MGVREDNKERNRQLILDGARAIFAQKGYHKTSISDIIRQTELSRATFYLYFRDKNEIFKTLMVDLFRAMVADFRPIRVSAREHDLDMAATMRMSAESAFRTMMEHRELVQTIINSPTGLDEDYDAIVQRYLNVLTEATTLAVRQGMAHKQIDVPNPELAGYLVYSGLREAVDRIIIRKEWDGTIEEAIDFIVQFYTGALSAFELAPA